MGAQTRHSLDQARTLLAGHSGVNKQLADNLFAAAVGLAGSKALRNALTDSSTDVAGRVALGNKAFASLSTDAKKLIGQLVALKWSRAEDLQAGLEELGIRVCAISASSTSDVVGDLLEMSRVVHSDPELELGLGSKRASGPAKGALVTALFGGKVAPESEAIMSHLVADPRGRRIGAMLQGAAEVVADQHGEGLAVVTVAKPLSAPQKKHIQGMLASHYGRGHYVAQTISSSVIGGARIRVGDDVIDGSIATRLHDLRTKLAG
jgi:F-type H+-transporting ATPase subunit delta